MQACGRDATMRAAGQRLRVSPCSDARRPSTKSSHPRPRPTTARPGAKNRPTPKRREQEALNKRPLIVTDRKAASAQDKKARREAMAKQRAGMMTGDEKYLPPGTRAPVAGSSATRSTPAGTSASSCCRSCSSCCCSASCGRAGRYGGLRARLRPHPRRHPRRGADVAPHAQQDRGKFGRPEKGDAWYAIMRAFQMRRTRMPKPQVARGEHPA